MCGIIGYIGEKPVVPVLIDGLRRLEYRGYDSAGVALVRDGDIEVRRSAGKLARLEEAIAEQPVDGEYGLGHTRWATHGRPTEENAHPHRDCTGRIVVVHNGIIENYLPLKLELETQGHRFATETDTEIIAHLVEREMRDDGLEQAVRRALTQVRGLFGMVLLAADDPHKLVAVRNGPPIVVGMGDREFLVASDVPAVLSHTRDVVFLGDGEMAVITRDGVAFTDLGGVPVDTTTQRITWDPVMAEKAGYKHFMLKEIYEQPDAVLDALRGRYLSDPSRVSLDEVPYTAEQIATINRVVLVGMGTSSNSTLVGRHYFERFARIPSEVDNASEFRYRQPVLDEHTLVVSVAQSGETVDTLAAMDEAQRAGCMQITLCNTPGAQTTRVADGTLHMRSGPEVAVASTKTMSASMLLLHALALYLGRQRGVLDDGLEAQQVEAALHLPVAIGQTLELASQIQEIAKHYAAFDDFLFLGRGLGFPIAMEGALKLKEVSYIHAEGYAAGEMKHGPIALIDPQTPTVAIAPRDSVFDKMRSNIEQVRARSGEVIAIVTKGDNSLDDLVTDSIELPEVDPLLAPLVSVIPLQLLSYYIALERGADIDQPRNLAKTVTVE